MFKRFLFKGKQRRAEAAESPNDDERRPEVTHSLSGIAQVNRLTPRFPLDPAEVHFYQLAWSPAQIMHKAWWQALDLEPWQFVYQTNPHCQRWIDNAIAVKRGFPLRGAPYKLAPAERQLLQLLEKLPLLLLALGLLRLGKPEYWMLKPYRDELQESLNNVACAQLGVFAAGSTPKGFHVQMPLLSTTEVAQVAQLQGMLLLAAALPDSAALRAIEIMFAPQQHEGQPPEKSVASFGLNLLFRLARFL